MADAQVPFTPLTPDDLAKLIPAERMAFTVAASKVARDENPGINTTAALLLTIQRLIGDPETPESDERNAIGQVIRKAESVLLEQGRPDAKELARVLLAICTPWTGGLRVPGAEAGAVMIRAERLRQVAVEGYTPEHDAEHDRGQLALAAAAYALAASGRAPQGSVWWPFDDWDFKPGTAPLDDLVKAGALIAAEIDRIAALKAQEGSNEKEADHG